MSEPTTEQAEATRQSSLSWQDRQDIIDYLRGRPEPIVANTKTEAAAIVATAAGVEVNAKQLWYLIEQLPKLNLASKFQIGVLTEPQELMRRDIIETHERLQSAHDRLGEMQVVVDRLVLRMTEVERREQAITDGQDQLIQTAHKLIERIEALERVTGKSGVLGSLSTRTAAPPQAEVFQPGARRSTKRDEAAEAAPQAQEQAGA